MLAVASTQRAPTRVRRRSLVCGVARPDAALGRDLLQARSLPTDGGMAVTARGGDVAGVIGHADRGSQYTSNDYLEFCHTHQIRPSVGRTGVCWDNVVAESFWESLKRECIQARVFATRADARRAIFRWINWYNTTRLHTSLNSIPPIEWEQQYLQAS